MNKQYDISNYMGMIAPPVSNEDVDDKFEVQAREHAKELSTMFLTYRERERHCPLQVQDSIKITLAEKFIMLMEGDE